MFDKPITDEEKRKRGKQIFTIEGNDIQLFLIDLA